jgi:hypothetical protein
LALSAQGAAAPLTGAEALFPVAGEDGLAILFADADPDLAINWASTPASEYNGSPFSGPTIGGDAGKLTFTGASLRMHYDSAGVLKFAGHNLCLQSQTIDSATWSKGANTTITANDAVAPDGTTTADLVTGAGAANTLTQSVTLAAASRSEFSFWAKRVTGQWLRVVVYDGGDGYQYWVDIQNGTAGTFAVLNGGTALTSSIVADGSYYKVTLSGIVPGTTNFLQMFMVDGNNSTTVANGSFHMWGFQFRRTPCSDTNYYATTTAAVFKQRYDYNPATLAARGLLIEEQRTNLQIRSQEFDNASWANIGSAETANATTAPDGTTTAEKLTEDGSIGRHLIYNTAGVTLTAAAYTASVYLKAAERTIVKIDLDVAGGSDGAFFELSGAGTARDIHADLTGATIQDVGNGWYRCTVTRTATAVSYFLAFAAVTTGTTDSYTGVNGNGFYVWGAQVELGAFATSYIPTTTASVTRATEAVTLAYSAIPSFSTAYIFIVEYVHFAVFSTTNYSRVVVGFGAVTNTALIGTNGSTTHKFWQANDPGADINLGTIVVDQIYKAAYLSKAGDYAVSLDGAAVSTSADATALGTPTSLIMGFGAGGNDPRFNGYIRKLVYLPRDRSNNAELQSMATQ